MHINKKAQFATEYLVITGIALSIIAVFIAYVLVYYSSYTTESNNDQLSTITSSIVQQANYVFSEGIGSKTSFTIDFPTIQTLNSFFCGDYIKITSPQYSSIGRAEVKLEGVLPATSGNYVMYARYNQTGIVEIGFDSPVTYINYSYSYSGSYLCYNLTIFNNKYIAFPAAYNITMFTSAGAYINSTIGASGVYPTSNCGAATGELYLHNTIPPEAIIDVFSTQTGGNVVAPSCFYT